MKQLEQVEMFSDTSAEAFESIIPLLARIEGEVFRVISESGVRGLPPTRWRSRSR